MGPGANLPGPLGLRGPLGRVRRAASRSTSGHSCPARPAGLPTFAKAVLSEDKSRQGEPLGLGGRAPWAAKPWSRAAGETTGGSHGETQPSRRARGSCPQPVSAERHGVCSRDPPQEGKAQVRGRCYRFAGNVCRARAAELVHGPGEFGAASSVADVIEVECEEVYAEAYVPDEAPTPTAAATEALLADPYQGDVRLGAFERQKRLSEDPVCRGVEIGKQQSGELRPRLIDDMTAFSS